jgi:hypothetical protein
MREASTACTVAGTLIALIGLVSVTIPFRWSTPSSNSDCTISSMKNGVP